MRKFISPFSCAVLIVALGTSVCARADDAALLGAGIGAAVGGLLGSQFSHGSGQFAATSLGVIAGGVIGNGVSHAVEAESVPRAGTDNTIVLYGEPTLIATNTYSPNYVAPPAPPPIYIDQEAGTYCREYSQTVNREGRWQESYGTACLQPDGSWRIVP